MSPTLYSLVHVASAFLLVGVTFKAFASPDASQKRQVMMLAGIFSLLMLVGGFGLIAKLNYGFPLWIVIKVLCWLGLSAMAGLAYRMPDKRPALVMTTRVLVILAVYCVYYRPGLD